VSDANVVKLLQPGSFADPLTEVLRNGARALLAQAIEAEVADFLAKHIDLKTATGLRRVVRHGHLPEREVMTGIGPVGVRQPRVRDRGAANDAGRIRFTPAILPPYARRSRSLEVLIPILYLKGISTGDFEETLAALLGKDAPGLSASTIARLKEVWLLAPKPPPPEPFRCHQNSAIARFSAAKVGPKSQYHSRTIASAAFRSGSGFAPVAVTTSSLRD
jgi:putative transposase